MNDSGYKETMLKKKDYTISILKDYSRLDEVYRLTHDTLAESGNIKQSYTGKLRTCPHLDKIDETTILIAEKDNKIIGTISVTIDGPFGLHTDKWFKTETDEIRRHVLTNLASSWRIATDPSYRGSRMLVLDLINNAFRIVKEKNCETCLFTFLNKHVRIYQRLIDAEIIKKLSVSIDNSMETELTLMKMDVMAGWESFRSRLV